MFIFCLKFDLFTFISAYFNGEIFPDNLVFPLLGYLLLFSSKFQYIKIIFRLVKAFSFIQNLYCHYFQKSLLNENNLLHFLYFTLIYMYFDVLFKYHSVRLNKKINYRFHFIKYSSIRKSISLKTKKGLNIFFKDFLPTYALVFFKAHCYTFLGH